jgi:hypothetical protein
MKQRLLTRIRAVKRPVRVIFYINFLALLLLSCQKEKPIDDGPPPDIPTARTTAKNLLAKFPPQNKRLIYNLLTATEKSDLWYYHLLEAIPQINATKAQRQYIDLLLHQLTPAFFERDNKLANATIDKLSQEVPKLFSKEQFIYLFYSLDDAHYVDFLSAYYQLDAEDTPNDLAKNCGCSKESDFCSGILKCQSADCEPTSSGCGFLWQYGCNGTCQH